MANTKISALPAVTTPAVTDQFPVNQGGTTKRMTLAQVRGGSVRVLKFDFAYDTPNIATGVTVWTPAIGDVILDAFIATTTVWNATALADIGAFTGIFIMGLNEAGGTPWDLTIPWNGSYGGGSTINSGGTSFSSNYANTISVINLGTNTGYLGVPAVVTTTDPIKLVVNQTGRSDGTASAATAGEASLYVIVATPLDLN